MATISSAGIGSGLDVESIVSQLVTLERKPITALQSTASKIQTQISSFGRVQSALSKIRDAAAKLATADTWSQRTAVSSDTAALTAKVTASGSPASYTIKPTQLVQAQSNSSSGFLAKTDPVGTGRLTIELGAWSADNAFTAKAGATAVEVTIGEDDDTLEKVRDKINAAGAGVSAAIVWDGSNYRLTVTSKEGGAANGFRIVADDDDGDPLDAAGLSRLTYDPAGGSTQMTRNQAGTDAVAWVNNLEVHSDSNLFDEVIDGVSFTIAKDTGASVSLDVSHDREAMKKGVQDFVSAYNEMNKLLRDLTRIDTANASNNGALQGDRAAINLRAQMRSLVGGSGPAGGSFARLSDIGVTAAADGTLSINDTRLGAALDTPEQLKTLFQGDGTTDGVAAQLRSVIDDLIGTDGAIAGRTTGLQDRLKRNEKDQDRIEDRVAATEKRLRAQYSALDTRMAGLTGLQSYLSQQITGWNKSSS
jgi:flagellar hook-associated protein 2